jgi:hypothetical protein
VQNLKPILLVENNSVDAVTLGNVKKTVEVVGTVAQLGTLSELLNG